MYEKENDLPDHGDNRTAFGSFLHLSISAGDIDEIISQIWSELPGVAEEAGVDVIVSTWDIVYRGDRMQFVDVTDLLVIFFDPTEETLGIIESMRGTPAIPSQFITEYD